MNTCLTFWTFQTTIFNTFLAFLDHFIWRWCRFLFYHPFSILPILGYGIFYAEHHTRLVPLENQTWFVSHLLFCVLDATLENLIYIVFDKVEQTYIKAPIVFSMKMRMFQDPMEGLNVHICVDAYAYLKTVCPVTFCWYPVTFEIFCKWYECIWQFQRFNKISQIVFKNVWISYVPKKVQFFINWLFNIFVADLFRELFCPSLTGMPWTPQLQRVAVKYL